MNTKTRETLKFCTIQFLDCEHLYNVVLNSVDFLAIYEEEYFYSDVIRSLLCHTVLCLKIRTPKELGQA